jgi:hypothetical protein
VLDLDYIEDSAPSADGNFVLTDGGNIVEAQISAEGATYDEEGLLRLLRLARIGCTNLRRAGRATGTMMRRLGPGRLVIASHNRGKIPEIAALLGPHGIEPSRRSTSTCPSRRRSAPTFID